VELTGRQRSLLQRWLPDAEVVKDHSGGVVGTAVLELRLDGDRYIAKAGGPQHFRSKPAFLEGYGPDPRDPAATGSNSGKPSTLLSTLTRSATQLSNNKVTG
jgi:hypothetical protein